MHSGDPNDVSRRMDIVAELSTVSQPEPRQTWTYRAKTDPQTEQALSQANTPERGRIVMAQLG